MNEDQPWWNDEDKVGGAVATVLLLTVVICICAILVALSIWFAEKIIS